jgi:trehalose 6-phosphate synthase/phosphatase
MVATFNKAGKRCILMDYDGTLTPITKLPAMASPSPELLEILRKLSSEPANNVIVISGRDSDTLETWLGQLPITLVAEHGACIRYKGEKWQLLASHTPEWKDEIRPILELFTNRCPGSFVEEKRNTLAWHYRTTNPDLGFTRSRELRNSLLQLTTNTPLQVIDGNKVIEVRLIGVDKGSTSLNLVNQLKPDFIMCIGDDTTDEDMFRAFRDEAFSIKIGGGNTAARFSLRSQQDVLPLLRKFLAPLSKKAYGKTQI